MSKSQMVDNKFKRRVFLLLVQLFLHVINSASGAGDLILFFLYNNSELLFCLGDASWGYVWVYALQDTAETCARSGFNILQYFSCRCYHIPTIL
jgi:hypothetical protein